MPADPLTTTLIDLLAAYYADADPSRLPIIADAMEEAGRLEDARDLRRYRLYLGAEQAWCVVVPTTASGSAVYHFATEERGRETIRRRVQAHYPLTPRTIAEYGCCLCQRWHDEDEGQIFWDHILRQGKHQGPRDKIVEGQWVERNEPYWTRRPERVCAAE